MLTHLARNADGHVRRLEGAPREEDVPRYPGGPAQRDGEIDEGARRSAVEIVNDLNTTQRRILALARALTWPARLVDLETQACQIVGDEFHDRLRSPGTGLHPAQWLRALAEETGAALRATLAQGADDWQKLWALLCGLALAAPRTPAGAVDETVRERLPEFPDIKDPRETALAEAEKFAKLAADRGVEPGLGHLADGWRPAGEPLVARDV